MSHALTIAVLLSVVFLSAYAGGLEMFVEDHSAPSRALPLGVSDPAETHVPPVHTIRPIIHDAYGVPEHHMSDARRRGSSSPPTASEEQPNGGLLAAVTNATTPVLVPIPVPPAMPPPVQVPPAMPPLDQVPNPSPALGQIDTMLGNLQNVMSAMT